MIQTAQILFPVNVPTAFDYAVPEQLRVARGDFVYAPIGKQMKLGVVWSIGPSQTDKTLKEIVDIKATRPLTEDLLDFVDWTARYTGAPVGNVLRMVIRNYKALDPSAIVRLYKPTGVEPNKMTPARRAVLGGGGPWPARASEVAERVGVSAGVVKGLVKAGGLVSIDGPVDPPFKPPNPDQAGRKLTESQRDAADDLVSMIRNGGFNAALLDGVTGSGKTEVYFEAVAEVIRRGGQCLILVPEIALTQAGLRRFAERFGAEPASWHSAMGEAARRRVWREVAHGRCKLVVGARSALYLPFPDLGLIVVDEEHDTSYKQEEGVIYNARDMAVVRAHISGHSVVLASATPSLETLHNARSGKFAHIVLPERVGAAVLPEIGLVDLKDNSPEKGKFLSQPLIDAVSDVRSRGEQALLYLNRRGYAPLIICRSCGEKLKSPDTDSWLVEHKRTGRAMCHLTGFSMRMPKECPNCKAEDSMTSIGPGVERIAEEAKEAFPDARIEILSSDTTRNPVELAARMRRMEQGEIDILIGTQMVVKGHNFPNLTFVGVVDGDLGLAGGDPRAGERTYQTLVQVAGRAGRAEKTGHALIQTHQPEHEALQALAAGDRDMFIGVELAMRDMLGLPPFGKLAAVIIWGPDAKKTHDLARKFLNQAPRAEGIEILGPSEAPISRLRGSYRFRLFIQADSCVNLSKYMSQWKNKLRAPARYKIQIDIDPQNFM